MKFFVSRNRWSEPPRAPRPFVLLREDNWDDYGFKTLYDAELHGPNGEPVELGQVKILQLGQQRGRPPIPDSFTRLGKDFCSVGQALSYYENLLELLTRPQATAYLLGLRDAAAHPRIRKRFQSEYGFETSLLREGSASRAIDDARQLLDEVNHPANAVGGEPLKFGFDTNVGGDQFRISFAFNTVSELPSRINAVIGYNGTGKTQLLANLALVAHADLHERASAQIRGQGTLTPFELRFGAVVAVSYSAFDTFDLPELNSAGRDSLARRGEVAGYVYCGLREYTGIAQSRRRLKDHQEMISDLERALKKIATEQRRRVLRDVLRPIYREPSFEMSSAAIDFFSKRIDWRVQFERLSTGHQISLNILVQLVAHLEKRSLVLIDEPESHLHPPLLAALLSGVSIALQRNDSIAVVATHAPVVIQEIPGRYVRTLSRAGSHTSVGSPNIETYGENLGTLTRHVFHLDNSASDFQGILARLGRRLTTEDVEQLGAPAKRPGAGDLVAEQRAIPLMRNLNPADRDAEVDFLAISGGRRIMATRALLSRAAPSVFAAYIQYATWWSTNVIGGSIAVADPLRPALLSNFAALDKGARYEDMRFDILSLVHQDNNLCPYCLVQYVGGALDHLLPKETYAEFSVLHLNLAPICDECNRRKGRMGPSSGHDFLHPYFSLLPSEKFIEADATLDQARVRFRYNTVHPTSMTSDRYKALVDQFEVLQLGRRWSDAAAREADEVVGLLPDRHSYGGRDGVSNFLMDLADAAAHKFGRSYWRAIAFEALAASDEFCDGGFKGLL